MCNECFQGVDFAESCRILRNAGFTGIEIAPFTLADDPQDLTAAQRAEFGRILRSEGLEFVGLHWLMVSPKGLHVTTPDSALRARSWGHIRNLIDLCADLGPNGVMVFGSPKQRSTTGGLTAAQAVDHFVEGLQSVAPHAEQRQVQILVEALPSDQNDIILTLAESVEVVARVGSPAVATMFDTHNAVDETDPHPEVLDRHFDQIRHIHVNEIDGKHPGQGMYPFRPVFEVLAKRSYTGWVSVEAFDFSFGGERIAQESMAALREASAGL
jgi:sugar phosphate isomerase/epimerase